MADIPVGVLETLFQQDGIELEGGGENKSAQCISPHHNDSKPSLSVNLTKGTYNCHGCGIKGNAYTYLTAIKGKSQSEAAEVLKAFGWGEDRFDHARQQEHKKAQKKKGVTGFAVPGVLEYWKGHKLIAQYDYRDKDGKIIASKGRYPYHKDPEEKDIRPYTPGRETWWMSAPWSDSIPEHDRCTDIPLYRLDGILATPRTRVVWVVEGEKDVDNIRTMADPPPNKKTGVPTPPPVTCLYTQKRDLLKHNDLTPLAGRKLLLCADQDEPGRKEMKAIGKLLADKFECSVQFVLPSGDGGYSVGDAATAGGWEGAKEWLYEHGIVNYEDVFKPDDKIVEETIKKRGIDLAKNEHFYVMGRMEKMVVIRSNALHDLHFFTANHLQQPGNLLDIAPREFWSEVCGDSSFNAPGARHVITDVILRIAEKKGFINMARIMLGRGAFQDNGRCFYYMGDHVLTEDDKGKLTVRMDINDITTKALRPGPHIHTAKHSGAPGYAKAIAECIHEYRWERPAHGVAFAGWIVTSLVGGALPFRPMLWLIGPPGAGKTYLVDPVFKAVLGNALLFVSNETEAGISEAVRDDSLPVWIDEFEPKKGREERTEQVLAYMRQSTSGEALRARGGPQAANNVVPRASICFSSVYQVNLGQANEERIVTLRLAREGLSAEEWMRLEKRFREAIEAKKMAAVRHWIIENTSWVVNRAAEIQSALLREGHTTRDSQIYGALSAGAELMFGEEKTLTPPVVDLGTEADEWKVLEVLFGTPMQMGGGRVTTLGTAIMKLMDPSGVETRADKELYGDFLENYGVGYRDLNTAQQFDTPSVLFAPTTEGFKKVFKGSEYESVNLKKCVGALKGMREEQSKRFRTGGAGRQRPLVMTVMRLQQLGFL